MRPTGSPPAPGGLRPAARPASARLGPPQEIAFTAGDGSRQLYLELLPQPFRARDAHHVLIALHGHGSDRRQFASEMRDECRGARAAAAARGMILVSPDYRAPASWMGPAAEADLVRIIGDLRQRHRVGRVVLAGGSMGGTSALIFTALHPELVAGTVALNGTANLLEFRGFAEAIAASYGGTREANPEEYRRRSPELSPGVFTGPIACTVGGRDTVVPPDSVRRLMAALAARGQPGLLIDRPEGGHATDLADTTAALDFVLDRALRSAP